MKTQILEKTQQTAVFSIAHLGNQPEKDFDVEGMKVSLHREGEKPMLLTFIKKLILFLRIKTLSKYLFVQ